MEPLATIAWRPRFEQKNLRLDDEVRFIRSWLEKPLPSAR